MRTLGSFSLVAVCLVAFACNKSDTTPAATSPATAASAYPAGYPAQTAPGAYPTTAPAGYPTATAPAGYPTAAAPYPTATTTTTTQTATTPGTAAPLATPGPLALPCTSDSACGLAHCNTQYGKCAFPCAAATDCISGAQCNTMTGLCLPGGTAH